MESNKSMAAFLKKAVHTLRAELSARTTLCENQENCVTDLEGSAKKLSNQQKFSETEATLPTTHIARFNGKNFTKQPISDITNDEPNKQNFLTNFYKSTTNLKVRSFSGFTSSNSRTSMRQDLTYQQNRINKAAWKQEGKIHQMRIVHGKPTIKIKPEDKIATLRNLTNFETFANTY